MRTAIRVPHPSSPAIPAGAHGVRRALAAAGLVVGLVAAATPVAAQAPVPRLLASARQYILDLKSDSAGLVLQRVLADSGASAAERAWGFSLMAIVRLEATDRSGAQTMFRQALRSDARLPMDSVGVLRELQSEAEGVLQETRRLYPAVDAAVSQPQVASVPLGVRFEVAAETTLAVVDGRLPIVPVPSRRARSVVTMALADAPGAILWRSDTLLAGGTGPVLWPVRAPDGRVVAPGRYLFAVTALDEAGEQARIEWVVAVERVAADTQPIPGPVRPDELRPETVQVRRRAPAGLALGIGLGAAALALPQLIGRPEVNAGLSRDGTAFVVAGSATVAGLMGFLGGRRAEYVPENAQYNVELRQQRASRIAEVVAANGLALERAPVRVRLERSGP
jgi:hypothetical protein